MARSKENNSAIGLKRGTVKLISHHTEWARLFKLEKESLQNILCDGAKIEHIGSTSIPGVPAKPILDIMIGLPTHVRVETLLRTLQSNGYEDRGEQGVPGRRFFAKGSEDCRTHYLHVVTIDTDQWASSIDFRNYLRKHKSARHEYNELKEDLADRFTQNRDEYTKRKGTFIAGLITKAQSS